MADIVTGSVTGQLDTTALIQDHSDIRRENALSESQVRRDIQSTSGDERREQAEIGAAGSYQNAMQHAGIIDVVKTTGWANSDRIGTEADRVVQQDTAYFIAGQSQNFSNATALAALKASTDASFLKTQSDIQLAGMSSAAAATLAGATAAAAAALEGAKAAAAAALGQAQIGYSIVADGNSTRALINTLKMEELNRVLTERSSEIIEQRADARHYRDGLANSQTYALSSQINALHSQFQAATQGTVNFGTMSGSAGSQAATNNSVR
jgi:hypothetical protein